MSLVVCLVVVGALLEAGGVALAAWEVRADVEHLTTSALDDLRWNIQDEVEGVRALLLRVTAPTQGVWTSLGFLGVGLIVQTVANVLSAR